MWGTVMLTGKRTRITPEQIQKSLQRDARNPAYMMKIQQRIGQAKAQLQAPVGDRPKQSH